MTAEGRYLLGTRPRGVCIVIAVARGRTVTELLTDYISPLLLLFHPTRVLMILWASVLHAARIPLHINPKTSCHLRFHYCTRLQVTSTILCELKTCLCVTFENRCLVDWMELLRKELFRLGLGVGTRSTRCKMTCLVHGVNDERGAVLQSCCF